MASIKQRFESMARAVAQQIAQSKIPMVRNKVRYHLISVSKSKSVVEVALIHLGYYHDGIQEVLLGNTYSLEEQVRMCGEEVKACKFYQIKRKREALHRLIEARFRLAQTKDIHTEIENLKVG
jgi:hypothetical protein